MLTPFLLLLWLQTAQPAGFVSGSVMSPAGMPAAGVRVYAVPVRDSANSGGATVLENISQTDAMGHFKLEVPPGRYYVAAGSLEQPTYFPGSREVSGARVITVTANSVVEQVDIRGFVAPAANRGLLSFALAPPGPTGVLSGILRLPDGSPAAGQRVTAVPTPSTPLAQPPQFFSAGGAVTGPSGNYTLSVPAGTYYIAAGYADSPSFYPGVGDMSGATAVTIAATAAKNNLDFTLPLAPAGTTFGGKVTAANDQPAAGGTVVLRARMQSSPPISPFLPLRPERQTNVAADGSFGFSDVPPGLYTIEARLPGVSAMNRIINVADQPVSGVDFSFQVAVVSGRIVWEDGSAFTNSQGVSEAALSTTNNPNFVATTVLSFDSNGVFRTVLDATDYKFYFRILPDEYVIKSVTSDGIDLMKQPLHVGRAPVSIEIRLAKASEVDRTGPKFSGRVLNNSGAPAAVERVQLCCFDAPFVQVSTRVAPDGSFEFAGIPPGKYGIGLKGRTTLYPAPSVIEIAADGVSGATIQATASFAPVTFSATVDGATPPRGFRATIVFSGVKGVTLISAEIKETTATASLPADNEYVVSLSNIPAGYTVKSITAGAINLSTGGRLGLPGNSFGDVRIVFTKIQ